MSSCLCGMYSTDGAISPDPSSSFYIQTHAHSRCVREVWKSPWALGKQKHQKIRTKSPRPHRLLTELLAPGPTSGCSLFKLNKFTLRFGVLFWISPERYRPRLRRFIACGAADAQWGQTCHHRGLWFSPALLLRPHAGHRLLHREILVWRESTILLAST